MKDNPESSRACQSGASPDAPPSTPIHWEDFPTHGFTLSEYEREDRLRSLLAINEQERWDHMHTSHTDDCWRIHWRCREAFLLAEIGRLRRPRRRR